MRRCHDLLGDVKSVLTRSGVLRDSLKLELTELRSNVVGARLGQQAIATSLRAGLIGFGIVILIMLAIRSKLKTVQMQRGAVNYIRPGSMNVAIARDTYLYSTVSRTAKPKNNSGSSTHSTGGSSFGGSSGKF